MNGSFGPVLVTGADTGIGRQTVETLAGRGYTIYATAYLQENVDILNSIENVKSTTLDVTNSASIDKLVEWVKEQGDSLYGIVNNAGITDYWPLVESTEEEFHRVLQVNLYGVVNVTRKLMPFIIENKGRIVNIGSLSGTIPTKLIGSYSISKFAVEAFTDILYFEVRKFGVTCVTIKPGDVQSGITKAMASLLKSKKDRYETSHYKDELSGAYQGIENQQFLDRVDKDKPDNVVNAISEALFSDNPKLKYLVTNEKDTQSAIGWSFRVIAQLLQNHPHAISRENLHQMLDQQLDKFH
ncbi:MAG: SDR family NAD(P)-dependent oxidoreductase [Candidatus Heimdallarchaeota archaeon]|nr:SDR family NAD(P)-dependent oxidoreductase [Candidatus Heimdallarchaeota archaeon]